MSANLIIDDQEPRLLQADRYVIGRGSTCDITLSAADTSVSRQHALLEYGSDGAWYIQDMNSHNGTLVNGHRITARVVLNEGDRLQIGESRIVLRMRPPTTGQEDTVTLSEADISPQGSSPAAFALPPQKEPVRVPHTPSPPPLQRPVETAPDAANVLTGPLRSSRNQSVGWVGGAMLLLSLFAYFVAVKPVIDEYNKPIGVLARSGGEIVDTLQKVIPGELAPVKKALDPIKAESDKHSSRYELALLIRQICLGVGLIGTALLLYGLVTTGRR